MRHPTRVLRVVLITYGTTFFVTAVICAIEIGLVLHPLDPTIAATLFILFALASLAFTLALSPFFSNARFAALAGPLLFFLTSQFYNVFLEGGSQSGMTSESGW